MLTAETCSILFILCVFNSENYIMNDITGSLLNHVDDMYHVRCAVAGHNRDKHDHDDNKYIIKNFQ